MYSGVTFIIRGSDNSIKGYIYKPASARRFVYIPLHKVRKYRVAINDSMGINLAPDVCFGINQKVLDERVKLSEELAKMAWYALSKWVNPGEVYTTIEMSQSQIEGLTAGAEAFIFSTKEYNERAKRLLAHMEEQDGRFNMKDMARELGINNILSYFN